MNILDFYRKKEDQIKISMVTCYDYTSAKLLAKTNIDCLLVGDSVAMVMHGYSNTLAATLPMMCEHTAAVSRGAADKFIISDLPFLSYRQSLSKSVSAAKRLMQAGAHALKLEGADGNLEVIRHLTESGVPVMGHLGLTPQFIHSLGGYKIQGRNAKSAERIKSAALELQQAGCFAIVLECVPKLLAADVTSLLTIPIIGIGAGPKTDGQVLVLQDLLGLNCNFTPKFVKQFLNGHQLFIEAIESFIQQIQSNGFPKDEHCY